jgi:hypothetical protein
VNNAHLCHFHQRIPMYTANLLEIKGDISLEAAQVYPGGMGSSMGFPPQMETGMPYVQPPQVNFSTGGFNANFGFPTAPPVVTTTSFPVGFFS